MNPKAAKFFLPALIVVVLAVPLVVTVPYYLHIMIMVFLFATMGLGWNLIGGYGAPAVRIPIMENPLRAGWSAAAVANRWAAGGRCEGGDGAKQQ